LKFLQCNEFVTGGFWLARHRELRQNATGKNQEPVCGTGGFVYRKIWI
jgi:hypothetical protein